MTQSFQRLRQLLAELKRRNVYRVAATYAVVAFITLQAARLIFPATTLEGVYDVLVVIAFVGFPLAIVLAWAFEMTPEGMRRTPEAEPTAAEARGDRLSTGYKVLVGLGLVAATAAGGWYLTGGGGSASEPRVGERSIAVLPFEELGQEKPGTFTEGMHDALLTRLSNVSELTVISRTAVQKYRGTDLSTGEIADSLGVRWVLEGGVQEMGEQIQVNAQLIDPRTEGHVWAESYRRDLTAEELFALQTEITKKIARSLEAELTPEEAERVERQPTEDLDAYRLYVKGRDQLDTRSEAGMREAVDYFRRAVEQDSSYALAWSGLADAIGLFKNKPYASPEDSLPDHEATARRAVELASDLAEARASMGLVHIDQHKAPAALRELQRAVDLKPSYAQAHHWLGYLLLTLGRLEEAGEHLSLAVELNPRHAAAREMIIGAALARGEAKEARRLLRAVPDSFVISPYLKADVLYQARRWERLREYVREELRKGEGDCAPCRFYVARVAALRGDTAAAREHLAEIREAEAHLQEGLVHAVLGDADEAFSAWREIESWGIGPIRVLRYFYADVLAPLRDDSRYRELIREANQHWGLNPDGSLPDSVDVSFESQSDD